MRPSASAIRCVVVWGGPNPHKLPEEAKATNQQQQPQRRTEEEHHRNPRPPLTLIMKTQLLLLTLNLESTTQLTERVPPPNRHDTISLANLNPPTKPQRR